MVAIEQRYNWIALSAGGLEVAHMPLTAPVDDVIALGYATPWREVRWFRRYGGQVWDEFGLAVTTEPAKIKSTTPVIAGRFGVKAFGESRRVKAWRKSDVPATFLRAARRATGGRLSTELTGWLAGITFSPDGPDRVPGFLELATWALDRALRTERFEIRRCGVCGVPFLSSGRSRYCQRLGPPSGSQECVDVGKVRDYQARRRTTHRKGR